MGCHGLKSTISCYCPIGSFQLHCSCIVLPVASRAEDGMGHSASFAHDHTEAFPLLNLPEEIFLSFCALLFNLSSCHLRLTLGLSMHTHNTDIVKVSG